MAQASIPYYLMRGGTSRGLYFRRSDLPEGREALSATLVAAFGSGHPLNIDGLGGGAAVTTKAAMLSEGSDGWADVDYFFAQAGVERPLVDFRPTCGNILAGVGPAAIEMGIARPSGDETTVRIHAVNTGARIEASVQTPGGAVSYEGDASIDGVPGTAAPIALRFLKVEGSVTGKLLPTGRLVDVIDGIEVTCMDLAMPLVIARASDFGLGGAESPAELDANRGFFGRMESVRLKAGELMGMGDVSESVTPKFALVAPASRGGTIAARYFMPWKTHPSMAVTGGQCIASCALAPGSVADGILDRPGSSPAKITLEHASGTMDVLVDYDLSGDSPRIRSAGILRTARKLARGELFVPARVLAGA